MTASTEVIKDIRRGLEVLKREESAPLMTLEEYRQANRQPFYAEPPAPKLHAWQPSKHKAKARKG